jgi:hypothetical protein
MLVVQFQHSHPIAAGTFANIGIEGPPEDNYFGGALDLTFAYEGAARRAANVNSAPTRNLLIFAVALAVSTP